MLPRRKPGDRAGTCFRAISAALVACAIAASVQFARQVQVAKLNAELIAAIKRNDCHAAIRALKDGADARAADNPEAQWHSVRLDRLLRQLLTPHRSAAIGTEALPLIYDHRDGDRECPELVQALLDHGAAVNSASTSANRTTALLGAVLFNHPRTVKILLEHGADPHTTWCGEPALCFARYDCAKLLLSHGANPLLRDKDGQTPLFSQATRGEVDPKLLDLLLRSDPDINQRDISGGTMLMNCINHTVLQHPIHWLLTRGANVNARQVGGKEAGYTALMFAASASKLYGWAIDVARELLARGADPYHKSARGETALDVANKVGSEQMVTVLRKWCRKHPRPPKRHRRVPAQVATPHGEPTDVEYVMYDHANAGPRANRDCTYRHVGERRVGA